MKATNIIWDLNQDNFTAAEKLPTEIEVQDKITDPEDISDFISDVTRFCHKGFCLEN